MQYVKYMRKIKEVLSIDWRKNILFLVLFVFISPFLEIFLPRFLSVETLGFPLVYYLHHVRSELATFRILTFLFDLIFWYLVSCIFCQKILKPKKRSIIDYLSGIVVIVLISWLVIDITIRSKVILILLK